ncbi:MAG: hypothetical protein HYY62_09115 [Deltaproteobacteria bacterium]|nr:hypothetical protein [Deltaproteobacteria bacterium]
MKFSKLFIGLLGLGCAFLSLLSSTSTVWAQEARHSTRFHMRVYEYDFFPSGSTIGKPGNGVYDNWVYFSYNNQVLKEEYDFNEDGFIDRTVEWVRIKKVVIETEDKNFDKKVDILLFDFSPFALNTTTYKYEFRDTNYDGYYDTFFIHTPTMIAQKEIHEPIDTSIQFLIQTLEKTGLNEEKIFPLGQTFSKMAEIQTLLLKKKWDLFFQKTREYLDLPSNDILPVTFQLMTEDQIQNNPGMIAKAKDFKYLLINPHITKDFDTWLWAIDHEMLRFIREQRVFEDLKKQEKSEVTWDQLVQYHLDLVNGTDNGVLYDLFKNPVPSSFYKKFKQSVQATPLFDELETHLYSYQRRNYYHLYILMKYPSYSNQIFMRAAYEIIHEMGLAIPDRYSKTLSEVKKILPILSKLPEAEVTQLKKNIRGTLSKTP